MGDAGRCLAPHSVELINVHRDEGGASSRELGAEARGDARSREGALCVGVGVVAMDPPLTTGAHSPHEARGGAGVHVGVGPWLFAVSTTC